MSRPAVARVFFHRGFRQNGVYYFTCSLFYFLSVLDALRTEWSLRERKSLMSTGFNIKKIHEISTLSLGTMTVV